MSRVQYQERTMKSGWAIGVDLGGTKIAIAPVAPTGKAGEMIQLPTPQNHTPEMIIAAIAEAVKPLVNGASSLPAGIGVGVAGSVNPDTGAVVFAPNLQWQNVPLQALLSQALSLPVSVVNDVRGATMGEWLYGAGQGIDDLVTLFIGTGIGGGIISGGRLVTGSGNAAGELGHIVVDMHGPKCTCGNRGCLEAVAGGWAIAKRVEEAVAKDPSAGAVIRRLNGGSCNKVKASVLKQAAQEGDKLAVEIIQEAVSAIVAGAVSLANAFNPKRIILGGGVVDAWPDLIGFVEQKVRQRAVACRASHCDVVSAQLSGKAGVIGAAAFAMRRQS